MKGPIHELNDCMQKSPNFRWKAYDLACQGERVLRVNFSFFPAAMDNTIAAREITRDFMVSRDFITPRTILELKEKAMLACLRKAYPEPPRSLLWHLRAWWRT